MKKILLSLFAVLMTVGAWAQTEKLKVSDAPTNDGKWAANTTWYTMKNGNGAYINKDYADADGNLQWNNNTASIEDAALWCIVGDAENGYLFYNKSAGTTKALTTTGAEANARTNFADVASATKFWFAESKKSGGYWCVRIDKEGNNYWNARDGYVALWNSTDAVNGWGNSGSGDNGSAILFEEVDLSGIVELTYTISDEAGNSYTSTYKGVAGETDPTFAGVTGYTLSDKKWDGNKLTATIKFPFPVSKEGGKTNATMISNFGASRNKLFADATSVKAILDEEITVSNLSTHLWAIFPEFTEGAFVFTVMNTATGKYIYSESNANSHDEGAVVLSEEASKMTVEGSNRFKLPTGKYLSLNSSTQTQAQYLGTWGAHNGCNLAFPSYAVVSLNEAGYASTYLPFNAALSEGLEAYAVTATSATKATLTALQGIKANQGAILKGAASTEYVLAAGNVSSDWSGNLLKGSTADTEVTGEGYVLSTVNSVTGFYAAKLTDGKFKNNAGKAYLPKSAEASARFISLDFGTETAIESVESVENNAAVYDLSGRRVQKAQKGLYIVNGKVVIK